jgi:preprotein translocase subunit YajC
VPPQAPIPSSACCRWSWSRWSSTFLLIRPQSKRQKEHKRMVEALAKGDEVVTMGGIAGRIADMGDNFAQVEVADGVQIKVRRAAVESVMPKGSLKDL